MARHFAETAINASCGDLIDTNRTEFLINPTGNFVIGGPQGDAGITGRKIIVDTYGGYAPHGGGAFSGKDPTKVDRSAAYMARWLAKNVVANDWADWCNIHRNKPTAYSTFSPVPSYRTYRVHETKAQAIG